MRYYNTRRDMVAELIPAASRIAEIGVFAGEFAVTLAETAPALLVLIDPWAGILTSGNCDGNNVVNIDGEAAFRTLKEKTKGVPFIDIRRGYSQDVLPEFPDNFFDVIYIDGDHSFEGCFRDLEISYRKVRPGGLILFHDYGQNYLKTNNRYDFGVQQAVDTFCIRYNQKVFALGLDGCVSGAIRLSKL